MSRPMSDTMKKVLNIIEQLMIETEHLKPQLRKLSLKSNFKEDLGFESVDFLDLGSRLEREFDILLPSLIAGKIPTVGNLNTYIKIQSKKPAANSELAENPLMKPGEKKPFIAPLLSSNHPLSSILSNPNFYKTNDDVKCPQFSQKACAKCTMNSITCQTNIALMRYAKTL